jgi:hypothetical protein
VLHWAFDERLDAPIRILASHPDAADGTAAMLDALYRLPADTTRASLWTTAQTAAAPLLAPAARDTFITAPGEATDLAGFIRAGGWTRRWACSWTRSPTSSRCRSCPR